MSRRHSFELAACRATVASLVAALLVLGSAPPASAAGRAIEDIRLLKQNGVATAEIVFSCPVRYLSHAPQSGTEIRIQVELDPECLTTIGRGLRSELYDPPSRNLAGINDVVFDTPEGRMATIAVRLGQYVRFDASQARLRNVVRVTLAPIADATVTQQRPPAGSAPPVSTASPSPPRSVATSPPSSTPPPASLPPSEASPSVQTAQLPRAAEPVPDPEPVADPARTEERRPIGLVPRSVPPGDRFVIQLAVAENLDATTVAGLGSRADDILYLSDYDAGERHWEELRLGFFTTEQQARDRIAELAPKFSQAMIAIADVTEQDRAAREQIAAEAAPTPTIAAEAAPTLTAGAANDSVGAASAAISSGPAITLAPERISALLAEANDAMLGANYDRSIQIYTRLLEDPSFAERREARERLGVARERKGQTAQAKIEYEAYLAEFPSGPDAQRVQQRLAGLTNATAPEQVALEASPSSDSLWKFSGGVAQYFRHDVLTPLEDGPDSEQSGILSNLDFSLRRNGERFEVMSRLDAAYHYNLLDASETSDPEDQLYVSNAYIEVADAKHDWSARVGRQSLYGSGVLGRFDGAHARYQWRPDIALNLTLGSPVEYPRRAIDTHRQFVGLSADMDALFKDIDFTFFGILQRIDGIADREAVGAEARYRRDRWDVVGVVDVDMSYAVLNSALVTVNWRATEKLTLNGRYNFGSMPFLTTRNALIGQSVTTIDDLLEFYSESQVRRLARDRTAQVSTGTFGLSRPVFDRFDLNVDIGYYETGSTVASGGVPAVPASGTQTFFYTSLIGSSFIKDGDTAIFSLRHNDMQSGASDAVVVDWRLPATRRLRLNPRLVLSTRTGTADGSDQWIAAPMLRMALRWPERHQFELEIGARLTSFDSSEESTEHFFNAGYWWEF
jgi:hypothetical protein